MAHLLLGCSFSKAVLHAVLSRVGALCCLPRPSESLRNVKAVRTLINLSLWRIWKLRNTCVFEGASPVVARLVEDIFVEADFWRAAGARRLDRLPLHSRPPDAGPSPPV
ncbi:hypothetical protein BRADI_3g48276v3 [Brachypodium distachyon]|uniref:Uncharacterized protein n=1 Tax=Brachypodium distachyon TaxID=15368 RepID=A0A0Q3FM25_BRADI|nr:hypothetical protein BRADI_3g48276v3 [Brachypodium distachyon]